MFKRVIIFICSVFIFVGCEQELKQTINNTSEETTLDASLENETETAQKARILHNSNELEHKNHQDKLKIHFIDADQADATLFEWTEQGEDHGLLYDAGKWNQNDVIHYLELQNIESIDVIIISHPHADHIGQLAAIIQEFEVKEVWFSGNNLSSKIFERAVEAVMTSHADYHEPRQGESFQYGPVEIEVLLPEELTGQMDEDSIVLRINYGDIKIMLTGDIHKEQELEMVKQLPSLEADILQLANHGSKTSSDEYFLQAVQPEVAIYSAGENNPYGYPHEEVVSLFKDLEIPLYGTEQDGTILIQTDGKEYEIFTKGEGTISPKSTGTP